MEKFILKNEDSQKNEAEEAVLTEHERSRDRKFEQREKHNYYHASKKRYIPGDIIESYFARDKEGELFKSKTKPSVYLTDNPAPHRSLVDREDLQDYFVYRVVPLDKVKFGSMDDELTTNKVRVVELIGHAGGFVERKQSSVVKHRRFPDYSQKNDDENTHMRVDPRESLRDVTDRIKKGKELLKKIEDKYDKH